MPDSKSTIPTWVALISICSAVAFASWTISSEVHNTRYRSLSTRADNHDFSIMDLREVDAGQNAIDVRLTTELTAFVKTLDEVRQDVKTLLSNQ